MHFDDDVAAGVVDRFVAAVSLSQFSIVYKYARRDIQHVIGRPSLFTSYHLGCSFFMHPKQSVRLFEAMLHEDIFQENANMIRMPIKLSSSPRLSKWARAFATQLPDATIYQPATMKFLTLFDLSAFENQAGRAVLILRSNRRLKYSYSIAATNTLLYNGKGIRFTVDGSDHRRYTIFTKDPFMTESKALLITKWATGEEMTDEDEETARAIIVMDEVTIVSHSQVNNQCSIL